LDAAVGTTATADNSRAATTAVHWRFQLLSILLQTEVQTLKFTGFRVQQKLFAVNNGA